MGCSVLDLYSGWDVYVGLFGVFVAGVGGEVDRIAETAQSHHHFAPARESSATPASKVCSSSPVTGIQFYSTSLTWAKVLGVPLIICAKDKKWYQRLEQVEGEVEWYEGKGIISETLTVLECGG